MVLTSPIVVPQTGIPTIDAEHAGLVECLERLQSYIEQGRGFAASLDAIQTLSLYVAEHFANEEAYLAAHQFPRLAEHVEQHRSIAHYVTTLYEQVLNGTEIQMALVDMMQEWIVRHIAVEDMGFAAYLGAAKSARTGTGH